MTSTTTTADISPLPPLRLPRPNETIETLRARLVYQSRKRGTLESDLVYKKFKESFSMKQIGIFIIGLPISGHHQIIGSGPRDVEGSCSERGQGGSQDSVVIT